MLHTAGSLERTQETNLINLHAETHLTFFLTFLPSTPSNVNPRKSSRATGSYFGGRIFPLLLFLSIFLFFFTLKDNKAVDVLPGPTFKPVKLIAVTICGNMRDTLALYLQTSFSAPSLLHLPVSNQEHLLCFSVEGFGALTPRINSSKYVMFKISNKFGAISEHSAPPRRSPAFYWLT